MLYHRIVGVYRDCVIATVVSLRNLLYIADTQYVHDGITADLNNLSNDSNDILLSCI